MEDKLENPGHQANSGVCNQSATEIVVDIVHLNYVQFAVCIPLPPYKKPPTKT